MQRFTGSWGNRLPLLVWLAVSAGLMSIGFIPMAQTIPMPVWVLRAVYLLAGVVMGLFAGHGLLEAFTVYQMDASSVVRRAWNGTRQLRWNEVIRYRASGQKDSTFRLFDEQGQILSVSLSLLGSKEQAELCALLLTHLTPVRERQLRDVGGVVQVFHPSRPKASLLLLMSFLVGLMLVVCVLTPVRPGEYGFRVFVCGFMALCELACLYFMAYLYSRTLTVTPHELTEKTLLREERIPLHHVTSVSSREVHHQQSTWEITTIEGDRQKIWFSSRMQDYDLLVQYVRSRISPEALQEGDAKTEETKREEARKARAQAPYVAAFIFCVFGGMGFWIVRQSQAKLATHHLIDARGQTVNGQVTGRYSMQGKTTRYFLEFVFVAEGRRIESESPIARDDYQRTYKGKPVTVIYVPGQPRVCRAAQSIGKRQAQVNIWLGYLNIVVGCIMPVQLLWQNRRRKTLAAGRQQKSVPATKQVKQ